MAAAVRRRHHILPVIHENFDYGAYAQKLDRKIREVAYINMILIRQIQCLQSLIAEIHRNSREVVVASIAYTNGPRNRRR